MKILYFFRENETMMYQWQRHHIFTELAFHGIEIKVFNPNQFNSLDDANLKLIAELKKNKYDLFMTPHNEKDLYIDSLKEMKHIGIPTLLICFDNLVVPFFHKNICLYFDLVWLTSFETEKYFKRWGATTIVLPYAASPIGSDYKAQPDTERIVFLGSPYGSRVNTINALLNEQIDLDIYGNINDKALASSPNYKELILAGLNLCKFPIGRKIILGALKQKYISKAELNISSPYFHQYGAVKVGQINNIYSKYALALSSTSARNTGVLKNPVGIINLRSFEIPMAYGLQICSYSKELSNYFEENKEIIFYRSEQELIDKTKYYLDHKQSECRKKIKCAAHNRAVQEHTWFCRFSKIFIEMRLNYKE